MHATVGNWLVVHGRNVDDTVREGQIIGVPHADGSPPYLVRWTDTDRVSLVFPGPDTTLAQAAPHAGIPQAAPHAGIPQAAPHAGIPQAAPHAAGAP